MNLYPILMDLTALLTVILCTVYYARKGFAAGLVGLLGTLAALVAAGLISYAAAPAVFDMFFRPGLEKGISETIAASAIGSLRELLYTIFGFLPNELVEFIYRSAQDNFDFSAPDVAQSVVSGVLRPVILPLITAVIFLLLFFLFRLLVGAVRRVVSGVARLPVISLANRALGAAMGVPVGAVYVYIVLCALWACDAASPAFRYGGAVFSGAVTWRLLYPLKFFG